MRRDLFVWMSAAAWLTTIVGVIYAWEQYDTAPGSEATSDSLQAASTHWQLTVFVHPQCPCSQATISELGEIVREFPEIHVNIVFVLPVGTDEGWQRRALWEDALRVAGATVTCDLQGREARRLGARTSGDTVLSDSSGQVVFRGGITRARGRFGESSGRKAIGNWVLGQPAPATTPIFGCSLFADE